MKLFIAFDDKRLKLSSSSDKMAKDFKRFIKVQIFSDGELSFGGNPRMFWDEPINIFDGADLIQKKKVDIV